MLTMIKGDNRYPYENIPSRTKSGQSWRVGTVDVHVGHENMKYISQTEVDATNGDRHEIEWWERYLDQKVLVDTVSDTNPFEGNLAVACATTCRNYRGYTDDPSIADLILHRVESRIQEEARKIYG